MCCPVPCAERRRGSGFTFLLMPFRCTVHHHRPASQVVCEHEWQHHLLLHMIFTIMWKLAVCAVTQATLMRRFAPVPMLPPHPGPAHCYTL